MRRGTKAAAAGLLAITLALGMAPALSTVAYAVEGKTIEVSAPDDLANAIAEAQDGDTIKLGAGVFTLSGGISKAISFEGAGEGLTIIKGQINYSNPTEEPVSISGVTLSFDGNTAADTAIVLTRNDSSGSKALKVSNSKIENYKFGINVNGAATDSGCTVSLDGVTFNNVWCGVGLKESVAKLGTCNIAGTTVYQVQAWGSVGGESRDGYYLTAAAYAADSTRENNNGNLYNIKPQTGLEFGEENYADTTVAIVTNEGGFPAYVQSLSQAVDNAQPGDTITLQKGAALSSQLVLDTDNVTLDLNGHKISGAEDFSPNGTDGGAYNLVTINGADGVTVKNGTISSGINNKNVLNVYKSTGVTVENMMLDHTVNSGSGAPMIVGDSAKVTVSGTLDVVTGPSSWYGINVDGKNGNATLDFADGSKTTFEGVSNKGISIEANGTGDPTVAFGQNSSVTSDVPNFHPIEIQESAANKATVTDPENAGINFNPETGASELFPVVTFYDGSTAFAKVRVGADGVVDMTGISTDKEGYIFTGWFSDDALTQGWSPAAAKITEDTNVYGRWARSVTVTFMNGSDVFTTEVVPVDTPLDLSGTVGVPTWEGHTFVGWYTDDKNMTDETTVNISDLTVSGDTTLYAGYVVDEQSAEEKPAGEQAPAEGTMPKTGDVTSFVPVAVAAAAGLTTLAGAATLRRREK